MRQSLLNKNITISSEKKTPVPAIMLGQEILSSCGATRLDAFAPSLRIPLICRLLLTECHTPAYILKEESLFSVRPRKSIQLLSPYRNPTICGSLERKSMKPTHSPSMVSTNSIAENKLLSILFFAFYQITETIASL